MRRQWGSDWLVLRGCEYEESVRVRLTCVERMWIWGDIEGPTNLCWEDVSMKRQWGSDWLVLRGCEYEETMRVQLTFVEGMWLWGDWVSDCLFLTGCDWDYLPTFEHILEMCAHFDYSILNLQMPSLHFHSLWFCIPSVACAYPLVTGLNSYLSYILNPCHFNVSLSSSS
jgi:hypothetical protein